MNSVLLELETLQRELHVSYRAIRNNHFPREHHASLVEAMEREGKLRMSIRQWLEWQARERRRPLLTTIAMLCLLGLVGAVSARAQTSITGCAVLTAPGAYTAPGGSTFNLGGPSDCIVIAGPGITFTADSLIINGPTFPPGGTGLHILATASGAIVNLTGNTNFGGTNATQPLTIGIEDDAADAQISIQGFIDAEFNPAGGTGFGIYLNNASGTNIQLTPDSTGTTDINGSTYGVFIAGGSHNTIVSGFDTFGDGGEAGVINGGTDAIVIQRSNHNVINHIFAGGPEGILVDTSPGNLIYNNTVEGDPYGIRVRWNSPNNAVVKNLVLTPEWLLVFDLFQGTHPITSTSCNGDYWADNTSFTLDGNDTPKIPTTNQPCVSTMQAMTAY